MHRVTRLLSMGELYRSLQVGKEQTADRMPRPSHIHVYIYITEIQSGY